MSGLIQGHASVQWDDQPEALLSQPLCCLNRASLSERSGHMQHIHPDGGDKPWWSKVTGSIAPWSFCSSWLDTASVLTSLQVEMWCIPICSEIIVELESEFSVSWLSEASVVQIISKNPIIPCVWFSPQYKVRCSEGFSIYLRPPRISLGLPCARRVKNPPAMRETCVGYLGQEDPLEEGMATHSSILAWRIPMDRGDWWATVHGIT